MGRLRPLHVETSSAAIATLVTTVKNCIENGLPSCTGMSVAIYVDRHILGARHIFFYIDNVTFVFTICRYAMSLQCPIQQQLMEFFDACFRRA